MPGHEQAHLGRGDHPVEHDEAGPVGGQAPEPRRQRIGGRRKLGARGAEHPDERLQHGGGLGTLAVPAAHVRVEHPTGEGLLALLLRPVQQQPGLAHPDGAVQQHQHRRTLPLPPGEQLVQPGPRPFPVDEPVGPEGQHPRHADRRGRRGDVPAHDNRSVEMTAGDIAADAAAATRVRVRVHARQCPSPPPRTPLFHNDPAHHGR